MYPKHSEKASAKSAVRAAPLSNARRAQVALQFRFTWGYNGDMWFDGFMRVLLRVLVVLVWVYTRSLRLVERVPHRFCEAMSRVSYASNNHLYISMHIYISISRERERET